MRPALLIALALFVLAVPARAQEVFHGGAFQALRGVPNRLGKICVLYAGEEPASVQSMSRLRLAPRATAPTATIEVVYNGFDGPEGQKAQEAFQRAVDIWERYIRSGVTIRVNASFSVLRENVLGQAFAPRVWTGTTDEGVTSWYPAALVDALEGTDMAVAENDDGANDVPDGAPDIVAEFNSEAPWYYGMGTPPEGTFDFTTVVLHELAHGLGFLGSMAVVNGQGGWGYTNQGGSLIRDQEGHVIPAIYDRFAKEGRTSGTALIDTTVYPNPSEALAGALTSENIFFGGFQALTAGGGRAPRLWAPDTWQQGSSYSHLHENIYPKASANALMTPFINPREVVRGPGAVVCGIFADMGWPLGPGCRRLVDPDLERFAAQIGADGAVTLTWLLVEDTDKDRFIVERSYFGGAFEPVRTVEREGKRRFTVRLDSVGLGQYAFRLRLVDVQDPSNVTISPEKRVDIELQALSAQAGSETASGNYDIAVEWTVPPGTAEFDYVVEGCEGERAACTERGDFEPMRRVTGRPEEIQYEAEIRVTGPGIYTYRLRMEDTQGHVLISDLSAPNLEGTVEIELEAAYALSMPFPNPFARSTQLDLTVAEGQEVTVALYNVLGQRVRQWRRFLEAHARDTFEIDARGLASGIYLVRVRGRTFTATRKIVVAR